MTIEEVKQEIADWNAVIENFNKYELANLLIANGIRVRNGEIRFADWFKAQSIIESQRFYARGHAIQMRLRGAGFDVKMDMQHYTLTLK